MPGFFSSSAGKARDVPRDLDRRALLYESDLPFQLHVPKNLALGHPIDQTANEPPRFPQEVGAGPAWRRRRRQRPTVFFPGNEASRPVRLGNSLARRDPRNATSTSSSPSKLSRSPSATSEGEFVRVGIWIFRSVSESRGK